MPSRTRYAVGSMGRGPNNKRPAWHVFYGVWGLLLRVWGNSFFWGKLVYRIVQFFWPPVRDYLLMSRCRSAKDYKVRGVCQNMPIGDWFLLYQVTKNMDAHVTRDLVTQLFNKFQARNRE